MIPESVDVVDTVIRLLGPEDFDRFWPVRLQALQECPGSFGASYEESKQLTREEAIGRLNPQDGGFVLGAFLREGGELVGILGFVRNPGLKNRHRGVIWGVYVVPQARGRGLARALMVRALEQCSRIEHLEIVLLTVSSGNQPARRLYLSLGFETYGLDKRALKVGEQYLDEELMSLRLGG